MAKKHGKDSVLTYAGQELTTFLTDISEDLTRDVADTTAMGQDAKTNVTGTYGGTLNLSGWWDPTDTTGPHDVLSTALLAGTYATADYGPHGDGTGAVKLSGSFAVTSYATTSPVEDTVAFTATLTLSGALTPGTYA